MEPGEEAEEESALQPPPSFLKTGALLEGGLVLVALAIEYFFPGNPPYPRVFSQLLNFSLPALGIGLLTGLLLVPPAMSLSRSKWPPFRKIQDILRELLSPLLIRMNWGMFVLIGGLAGLGEEVLFRGVLEPRLGVIGSNLLFGLLHPITVTYVLLVIAAGMIFSGLNVWTGSLWAPILAHGVYDIVILTLMARKYRQEVASTPSTGQESQQTADPKA